MGTSEIVEELARYVSLRARTRPGLPEVGDGATVLVEDEFRKARDAIWCHVLSTLESEMPT